MGYLKMKFPSHLAKVGDAKATAHCLGEVLRVHGKPAPPGISSSPAQGLGFRASPASVTLKLL